MDTKETLMLIQMIITPIVSISIPFIAAKLAKAKPKENIENTRKIPDSRWTKPIMWPFILLAAYNVVGFTVTLVTSSVVSPPLIGVLVLYSGGFFMAVFLCFFSIFFYSLRRGMDIDRSSAMKDHAQLVRRVEQVYELIEAGIPRQKERIAEQGAAEQPAISDSIS